MLIGRWLAALTAAERRSTRLSVVVLDVDAVAVVEWWWPREVARHPRSLSLSSSYSCLLCHHHHDSAICLALWLKASK